MCRIVFSERAFSEYVYWQIQDKKTLKLISQVLKDVERNGNWDIGKRESLKYREGSIAAHQEAKFAEKNEI